MSETAELPSMGKKMGRPKGEHVHVSVKIEKSLASKAKILAGENGVSIPALLTELLQQPLDRAYGELVRKIEKGSK